jgi:hypothetical protein
MADKGIRVNVNHKFVELLPQRTELGNTRFRAEVIGYAMEEFGITLASAATHYNHAKIEAAKVPELAAQMEGLGRAEDKKGGRKPKAKTEAVVIGDVAEMQQTEFTVKRKSNGDVVAEKLSYTDAVALVAKAAAAKKAKLYWV